MTDDRLAQARELIKAKDYQSARQLLKPIRHDETARRWLDRLDEIAPEEDNEQSLSVMLTVFGVVIGAIVAGGAWGALALVTDEPPHAGFVLIGLLTGATTSGFGGRRNRLAGLVAMIGTLCGIIVGVYVAAFFKPFDGLPRFNAETLTQIESILTIPLASHFSPIDLLWVPLALIASWRLASGWGQSVKTDHSTTKPE